MEQVVIDRFVNSLPARPYAADSFKAGLRITDRESALNHEHIQLNGVIRRYLPFDVDREGAAYAWEDAGLPGPSIVVINPDNGHSHLLYELDSPVVFHGSNGSGKARKAPMDYYKSVYGAYARRLGADPAYHGLMVKNPLHNRWRTITYNRPRELGELAESVDLRGARNWCQGADIIDTDEVGTIIQGYRNETLFKLGRKFAYGHIRGATCYESLLNMVLGYCFTLNMQCMPPLFDREIESIGKSIAKYCWQHREAIIRNSRNRGAMRLDPIPGRLNWDDRRMLIRIRQSDGARFTNEMRRAETTRRIQEAIGQLKQSDERVTKAGVARLIGLSREIISRLYAHLFDDEA